MKRPTTRSLCDLTVSQVNGDVLPCWPVTWGIPFRKGLLSKPEHLAIQCADKSLLPVQSRALTKYPDGSIRRLLVTAEIPIPGPGTCFFRLVETKGVASFRGSPARVSKDSLSGECGSIKISSEGLLLETKFGEARLTVSAQGKVDGAAGGFHALTWKLDAIDFFETGPVMVAALVKGNFFHGSKSILHTRFTLRLFQSTPVILCDVLALNLSDHKSVEIDSFQLKLQHSEKQWLDVAYEIRREVPYTPTQSKLPFEVRSKKLALEFRNLEGNREESSRFWSYNETWLSASDEVSRTVLAVPNFFEYFPYGVRVEPDAMVIDCWPQWHGKPWTLEQGGGKTHSIGISYLPAKDSPWTSRAVGYAVCKPPMPGIPLKQFQQGGVLGELLEYQPKRHPRIETTLFDLTHNRNRGYGKMNWGDDYSPLYTSQKRGEEKIVWNNLEGDHPYHMWCQYLRTGQFEYYKDFRDSILHWADVDFCDHSDDPLKKGALQAHCAGHWTLGWMSPCHNWAEGFKEWYFATGDPRPLEILEKMADWIIRRAKNGDFSMIPEPRTVRVCGWGMIQMVALQEVLERKEIRQILKTLCSDLLAYCRKNNGMVMTLPYSAFVPRDNAFHTATVVIGAYMCWKMDGNKTARDLAILASEALMDERTANAEGIPVYISGPEQDIPIQQAATLSMGALGAAYYLTKNPRYVRRGMRMLEYCLDRGMIVDHQRIPGEFLEWGDDVVENVALTMPNSQLLGYQLRGLLLFMKAAHQAGMLKKIEYKF